MLDASENYQSGRKRTRLLRTNYRGHRSRDGAKKPDVKQEKFEACPNFSLRPSVAPCTKDCLRGGADTTRVLVTKAKGKGQRLPPHFIFSSRKSHIHAGTASNCTWSVVLKQLVPEGMFSTVVLKKYIFILESSCLQCKSNITLPWILFTILNEYMKSSLDESMTIPLWSEEEN